jgi:hypothetical protein
LLFGPAPHADRDERAQGPVVGALAAVDHPFAQRAGQDREHDVVGRAAVGSADPPDFGGGQPDETQPSLGRRRRADRRKW